MLNRLTHRYSLSLFASVLLSRIFPANERVCLNIHRLCFVDNWLLHPISENWYFTLPSYSRHVQKVECANHAVKCYRNRLEALCKEHPEYRRRHGLSEAKMKRITHGARCAIKMHSKTGDVAALRHDLRNGIRHYFGDHRSCNFAYCKNTNTDTSNDIIIQINKINVYTGAPVLSRLPPNFLHDAESALGSKS